MLLPKRKKKLWGKRHIEAKNLYLKYNSPTKDNLSTRTFSPFIIKLSVLIPSHSWFVLLKLELDVVTEEDLFLILFVIFGASLKDIFRGLFFWWSFISRRASCVFATSYQQYNFGNYCEIVIIINYYREDWLISQFQFEYNKVK